MYNYTSTISHATVEPDSGTSGTALSPLTTGLPAPWHYAKCWVDNAHGRILINEGLAPSASMTALTCINFCNSQGFVLAGLQFSQGL